MKRAPVLLASLILVVAGFAQGPSPNRGVVVSGRVIDGSTGKPMTGAVVFLWQGETSRTSGRQINAAPDGTFEFANVAPGAYHISPALAEPRFSYRTEPLDITVADRDITGLGLLISPVGPPLISISGKLVMENGVRIPASISRIRAGENVSAINPDGTFQLRFRAREKYEITLETPPESYYIKSASAGTWDANSQMLVFMNTPPSMLQLTVAVGDRRIGGRILDAAGSPAGAGTVVTVRGPANRSRSVVLSPSGTFDIAGLRAGEYQIKAVRGTGDSTQLATSKQVIESRDVTGVEIVLKTRTAQKGQLVMEGIARLEDVLRFTPEVSLTDALETRSVPILKDGTFEFQGFAGEFIAQMRGLPFGYSSEILPGPSSTEVRIRVLQGLPVR